MTTVLNPAFLNAACARPAAQEPEEEQTPDLNNENPEEQPENPEEEQTEQPE